MQTKIYALLVALLASVAFVGCTSDNDVADDGTMTQLSFSAVTDGGNVSNHASERMKTQLHPNEGNSVTFCSGDAISVFDGTTQQNKRFATNTSGASVTFSGAAPESQNYTALYPYQEGATISDGVISAILPTTQYAQTGTTYDPQAALSVATTTRNAMTFNFKNVCALVKVTTVEPLSKIVFKGNSDEKVAGNVAITVADAPTATGDAESIELLPASPATTIAAGTYYIAVLPQAFANGFTLEAYKTSSSATADYVLNINTPVEVERSCVLNVGELNQYTGVDTNGHEYVDLGIEVTEDGKTYKLLWATMNVGASAPEKYGDYFAWGETEPKTEYSWNTYKLGTSSALTKYNGTDGKTVLDLADDAARQNWGGDWVMPTQAEWQALYKNTTSTWTGDYNGTGVKGLVLTSKSDASKSIFLPVAGYFYGSSVELAGSCGYYWSSSLFAGSPASAYA